MRWTLLIAIVSVSLLAGAQSFHTTVEPLPDEDFAGPCHYDLTLPAGKSSVRAVWVTYDRGRDIMKFYSDPSVVAFARRRHFALMMPHQCVGKNAPGGREEMDMDPTHGVGRALFTALDQLAAETGHPELSSAKLILLGFSGTGALFAHFVEFAPDRVLASIPANAGHYDPMGIDTVRLSSAGVEVPELVIAGGADKISGTQRPYDYFIKYRSRGAPWAFLIQNRTPHCCVSNTEPLILAWLDELTSLRQPLPGQPLRAIDTRRGWIGYMRTFPSDVRDSWGAATWNGYDAGISKAAATVPPEMVPAGWFPSHRVAEMWLKFVKQPTHPVASLP